MIYAAFFLIFAMTAQALFYAGCDVPRPSPFADGLIAQAPCGLDISTIYHRLSVLAYPQVATILLVAGWIVLFCGVLYACAALHPGREINH